MSNLSLCADICEARCCKQKNLSIPLWDEDDGSLFPLLRTTTRDDGTTYREVFLSDYPDARCPNLTDDNRCGVYERRPHNCREWPHGQMMEGCALSMLAVDFTGHRLVPLGRRMGPPQ